jgi:Protein of unknown function (DUF2953).
MKQTKAWMLKEIKSLIFHIKPKKLQGNIRFGLEDPCLTGEILAVAGVFYPLYGEYFTIEPFFEEQILEGEISFRGRIYGIYFALLAWRIFQNRELRFIIKNLSILRRKQNMASENNFQTTVESLFKGMDSFITTKTVVGE